MYNQDMENINLQELLKDVKLLNDYIMLPDGSIAWIPDLIEAECK
jgi:hypothetical protein